MSHIARTLLVGIVIAGVISLWYLTASGLCFTSSSSTAAATVNRVSLGEKLMSAEPKKMNTAKVDQALHLLIDTMFRERRVKDAFERDFRFSSPTTEEMDVIDETSDLYYSDSFAKNKDVRIAARAFAVAWNYEYQPVFLALGIASLSNEANFKESLQRAQGEVERERKGILSKHSISDDAFYKLEGQVTHGQANDQNLATLEMIQAELQCFINQKINPAIYNKNIMMMEKDRMVQKRGSGSQALYVAAFKPMFKVVFVQQGDALKMISFGDVR